MKEYLKGTEISYLQTEIGTNKHRKETLVICIDGIKTVH